MLRCNGKMSKRHVISVVGQSDQTDPLPLFREGQCNSGFVLRLRLRFGRGLAGAIWIRCSRCGFFLRGLGRRGARRLASLYRDDK